MTISQPLSYKIPMANKKLDKNGSSCYISSVVINMADNGAQEEELEVLRAIYEEDELFSELNATTFQYRFGELGEKKSFLLEVQWPELYPECLPHINLNAFYNRHISSELKGIIINRITDEIAENVGLAMTFTIFSWVGENFEQLMEKHLDFIAETNERSSIAPTNCESNHKPTTEKKVQLTKQQKRKLADRTNYKGERERGWNWVDIVKHLSKTG